jgi:outer membrane protein OmpA-like peptidoglycan-associated protein
VRSSALLAAAGLLVTADVHAEPTRNIELTVFDPTPTTVGSTFQVQTADVGKSGELVISTWLSYAANPLVLGTVQNDDPVVRHRTGIVLGGAYAFGNRFEAGARIPFYVQSGEPVVPPTPGEPPTFGVTPASGAVLGDLAIHGKACLAGSPRWQLGALLTLKLPTASDSEFAGTDMPSLRGVLLLSLAPSSQLTVLLNAGGIARKQVEFANIEQGSGATWGAALSYRAARAVFLNVEAFGDLVPGGQVDEMGQSSLQATIEGLAGVRYHASRQLSLGLAAGRGLTSGIGAPDLRGMFTLSFTPNARPLPPLHTTAPEEPIDPNTHDADFDRIVDADDKCPDDREDKDGFEDEDGCPDLDNDNDGVPDDKDKCGDAVEDRDGFDDSDGCPDPDNDRDGVADGDDQCPKEPEKINGVEDEDGCPDKGESLVISAPERLELLEAIVFDGTAVSRSSANLLGQLAATLRARQDIVRLRVGVHVQPTKRKSRDQSLSDRRAAALRDWLVAHGVEADRIDPKGFGSTKPLVPANQKGAAAINDRVELIILERK